MTLKTSVRVLTAGLLLGLPLFSGCSDSANDDTSGTAGTGTIETDVDNDRVPDATGTPEGRGTGQGTEFRNPEGELPPPGDQPITPPATSPSTQPNAEPAPAPSGESPNPPEATTPPANDAATAAPESPKVEGSTGNP